MSGYDPAWDDGYYCPVCDCDCNDCHCSDEMTPEKMQSVAWETVVNTLREHNPKLMFTGGHGLSCVIREVKRLQALEKIHA